MRIPGKEVGEVSGGRPWQAAGRFVRDFSRFSGRNGVVGAVLVVASALLESIGLILLIPLLGITIGAMPGGSILTGMVRATFRALSLDTHFARLMFLLTVFALLMVLRLLVSAARDYVLARTQIEFVDACRTGVIRRIAAARWEKVSRIRHARVAQIASADVQRIGQATRLLQQSGVALVMLTAQCVAALAVSPMLALLCFVLLGLTEVALSVTLRRAHLLGEGISGTNLATMNMIVQFFGGLKLAVSQDLQRSYVAGMEGMLRDLAERQLAFVRSQAIRQIATGIVAAAIGIAICAIGLGTLKIQAPIVVGLLLILVRMSGPAITLQQNAQQLMQALPAYDALKRLDAEFEAAAAPDVEPGPDLRPFSGEIVFDRVGFAHSDEGTAQGGIEQVSVAIAPGTFIGITGPSGAGKTSFVDLLAGLYAPHRGEVRIDGVPLTGAAVTAWRRQISYVGQDPYLFHDSIRHNLLWANPAASEDELWAALRIAGAEALVRAMPHGIDETVGERGTLVSGGERQRLAIARALVRNPRLIVLDEATNAIDVEGERSLIAALLALEPRPTIVMIAHRSESLARCERLLTFEAGRLADDRAAE